MNGKERLRLYVSIFIGSLGLGTYTFFVPIFAQKFDATFLDLGYIGAAYASTYAVAPIVVGHLADRVNRSRLYALSLLINFIATIALLFSHSVGDIVLVRALGGLGLAFYWPITEILVIDLAPKEQRVKEMGLYSVSWGSAFLVGPFVGGLIIQNFGFSELFVFSSFLIMLAFLQTVLLVPRDYHRKEGRTLRISEGFRVMRQLMPWYVLIAFYGIIVSIVTSIFPGYANSVGVNAVLVGVIFTVFGISRVAGFASSDRCLSFGEKKTLVLASLLISCGSLGIAFYPSFTTFLVAVALIGGCFAIFFPITIGLISRHFPEEQTGAAVGSYESVLGVGSTIGPILAGAVAAFSSVMLSFVSVSLLAVLMMIIVATAKTYSKN